MSTEPVDTAALRTEVARLEWADALVSQVCPAGKHVEWFVNAENHYRCPWCEVDRLTATLDRVRAEADRLRVSVAEKRAAYKGAYQAGFEDGATSERDKTVPDADAG